MPQNIFVLTGAGVSAESGLGTFRDKTGNGIWAKFDPMKLATPEAFARDPEAVLAFYDLRRRNLLNAKPNAAHFALARLEGALAEHGETLTLVTQNIDDLHERTGSRRVIHMHGELLKARCGRCARPTFSSPSVLQAPSIPPPASSQRRALMACALARSTLRPPTMRTCSMSSAWGRRARRFRLGSTRPSEARQSRTNL